MEDGAKFETEEAAERETAGLGLSRDESRKFMSFTDEAEGREGRTAMLRCKRRALLDEIHERQRIIDNIDCLIWRWQRNEKGNKK